MGRIEGAAEEPDPHAGTMRGNAQAPARRACPDPPLAGGTARLAALVHQRGGPMMRELPCAPVTA
jgi:hypothetical protein